MSAADHDDCWNDESELGDAAMARWPLDPHSLLPRERWLWYDDLWADVCALRTRYQLPIRAGWWESHL